MVFCFAGRTRSSKIWVGCEVLFSAQKFVMSLNISLSCNLPFNYIVSCSLRKGRRWETKKPKNKKKVLKMCAAFRIRFHLIKFLLQCPPSLIVPWNSESLMFVSEDKCFSHVLSWHLWDELSIWREGRTFDASNVILGPPLFWESLTHVVWVVKPSRGWHWADSPAD